MRKRWMVLLGALALGGCASGNAYRERAVGYQSAATEAAARGDFNRAGAFAGRATYQWEQANPRLQHDARKQAKLEQKGAPAPM